MDATQAVVQEILGRLELEGHDADEAALIIKADIDEYRVRVYRAVRYSWLTGALKLLRDNSINYIISPYDSGYGLSVSALNGGDSLTFLVDLYGEALRVSVNDRVTGFRHKAIRILTDDKAYDRKKVIAVFVEEFLGYYLSLLSLREVRG